MQNTLDMRTALGPNDPDDGDAGRQQRGLAIAALTRITKNSQGYLVPSQSTYGTYQVALEGDAHCNCPDYIKRQRPCKHVYAVIFSVNREQQPDGTTVETSRLTVVRGGRNWSAYNDGQTNEGEYFARLLRELCDTVPEPEQHMGRPRKRLSDMVFSMALKVYGEKSSRRTISYLKQAGASAGLLDDMPSFNSIGNYMNKPEVHPLLVRLIELSALPMAALETRFAIDSSGFGSLVYERWFDVKWQRKGSQAMWTKANIAIGVDTHIVTAVEVTDFPQHDSVPFRRFVETIARNFDVEAISADKAYLSAKNLQAVVDAGGRPYIPMKVNSKPSAKDGKEAETWNWLYHLYHMNRPAFDREYHQRSNVEAAFAMMKRNFGSFVRSRNPIAQVNETLVKILCHNVVVLIQSMFNLGVMPAFDDHLMLDAAA